MVVAWSKQMSSPLKMVNTTTMIHCRHGLLREFHLVSSSKRVLERILSYENENSFTRTNPCSHEWLCNRLRGQLVQLAIECVSPITESQLNCTISSNKLQFWVFSHVRWLNWIVLLNRLRLKLRGERFIYSLVTVILKKGLCPKSYFPLDKNQVKYLKVGLIYVR